MAKRISIIGIVSLLVLILFVFSIWLFFFNENIEIIIFKDGKEVNEISILYGYQDVFPSGKIPLYRNISKQDLTFNWVKENCDLITPFTEFDEIVFGKGSGEVATYSCVSPYIVQIVKYDTKPSE